MRVDVRPLLHQRALDFLMANARTLQARLQVDAMHVAHAHNQILVRQCVLDPLPHDLLARRTQVVHVRAPVARQGLAFRLRVALPP